MLYETGLVATTPRHTHNGDTDIVTFRMASPRKSDESSNWFTVIVNGNLAKNFAESVKRGDRVIVLGELNIRDWESGDRDGTVMEIHAEHIGHDLNHGVSSFERVFHED